MGLSVNLVRLPLTSPFSDSGSKRVAREALILRLEEEGVVALSECVTDSQRSSSGEDNRTALRAIRDDYSRVLRRLPHPAELDESTPRRNPMAWAAIEMVLWDYHAKKARRPLDKFLGGSRGYALAGISLGLMGSSEMKRCVEDALSRGYKRIKVKIERKSCIKTLEGIRDFFPEIPLSADANGCFLLPRDDKTLRQLDRFDLQYLEQPLPPDDISGSASLARLISTPICLDESVTSLARTQQILERRAAEIVNLKPGRVGGLSVALNILRFSRSLKAHVWVGGMLETGIGRAFNIALASQKLIDLPGDTSSNDRFFEKDIVSNPFSMKDGRIDANSGAGIGTDLDRDFLANVTVGAWKVF